MSLPPRTSPTLTQFLIAAGRHHPDAREPILALLPDAACKAIAKSGVPKNLASLVPVNITKPGQRASGTFTARTARREGTDVLFNKGLTGICLTKPKGIDSQAPRCMIHRTWRGRASPIVVPEGKMGLA